MKKKYKQCTFNFAMQPALKEKILSFVDEVNDNSQMDDKYTMSKFIREAILLKIRKENI
jgi:hypothetical protein